MAIDYSRKDFLSDFLVVLVLGLIAWGAYHLMKTRLPAILQARAERARRELTPLEPGTPIEDAWSVQSLDGRQTFPLSTLKGKVLFLNFWATWCSPCRMELPSIEKLYERYRDTDVMFLCLTNEDPRVVQRFIQKRKIELPIYTVLQAPPSFRVTGLPSTFIVSRFGKVALSRSGAFRWDKHEITVLLDSLLAEKEDLAPRPTGPSR